MMSRAAPPSLRVVIAVAIVLGLHVTAASPTPEDVTKHLDEHQIELKEHYEHLSYIEDFKCHTPQVRTIPVHKLISEEESHGKAYFPDVTVVHRCDQGSGCCSNGHHCTRVHSEWIRLPFKVTYLDDIGHHKRGSWGMEYHFLENHTLCDCLEHLPDEHAEELKHHYEHVEYVSEHPCHVPQPRTIPVDELFSKDEIHGKAFFPDQTVLHHCGMSTGSCMSGHCCQPLHIHHVKLPFKVTFLEDFEHHKRGSWSIEYYLVANHTECGCSEVPPPEEHHPSPIPEQVPMKDIGVGPVDSSLIPETTSSSSNAALIESTTTSVESSTAILESKIENNEQTVDFKNSEVV